MQLITVGTLNVGEDDFIESCPQSAGNGVVFEDNSETGYLYALERKADQQLIIFDAVHIYNVADATDKGIPSEIKVFWNDNFDMAAFLINDYCHAIMDFKNKTGLCRTGFPHPGEHWPNGDRKLSDEDVEIFFKNN